MSAIKKLHHPIWFAAALFLGLAIGYRTYEWKHLGNSEPLFLITAVTIMIISMLNDRLFETRALRTLEDITEASASNWTRLTDWVIENLSPNIISLEDRDAVLKEASTLIDASAKEGIESKKYVVYIGSGDLMQDAPTEESETNTPVMEYQSAMERAKRDEVKIIRYISLLSKQDYKQRQDRTRAAYVTWLKKQIKTLDNNPNYKFWVCPRAPQWGSVRSSIFTEHALLDVVGNGERGVLIRGDKVAQALLKGSQQLFEDAFVKPIIRSGNDLRSHLSEIEGGPHVPESAVNN